MSKRLEAEKTLNRVSTQSRGGGHLQRKVTMRVTRMICTVFFAKGAPAQYGGRRISTSSRTVPISDFTAQNTTSKQRQPVTQHPFTPSLTLFGITMFQIPHLLDLSSVGSFPVYLHNWEQITDLWILQCVTRCHLELLSVPQQVVCPQPLAFATDHMAVREESAFSRGSQSQQSISQLWTM